MKNKNESSKLDYVKIFLSNFIGTFGRVAAWGLLGILLSIGAYFSYQQFIVKPAAAAKEAIVAAPGKMMDATKQKLSDLKPDCWTLVNCEPKTSENNSDVSLEIETYTEAKSEATEVKDEVIEKTSSKWKFWK